MKKYYYAKLVGYVQLVSNDKKLVDWYLDINKDVPVQIQGFVEAESDWDASAKVWALLGVTIRG